MKKTIIVLGCPRSGTSLLAGLLNKAGVNMGDKLRKADNGNPTGYFEDVELLRLSDKLFKESDGLRWTKSLPREGLLETVFDNYDEKIKEKIKEKNENDIWGAKVGMNFTIAYWLPYLRNPEVAIIFRNPVSVLNSMVKLKDISINLALFLYIENVRAIVKFYEVYKYKIKVVLFKYEEIIRNPEIEIKRLVKEFGLELDKNEFDEMLEFVKNK